MTFVGWSFAAVATAFGVAGALVTGLYLLRMRRRELPVPFAALWEQVTRESEARRLWRRLRRVVSWLLQVLLVALVVLAIADPRSTASLAPARRIVIVLDASASMAGPATTSAALDDTVSSSERAEGAPPTRLDVAKALASDVTRDLGSRDALAVIVAGGELEVRSPLGGDHVEARRRIEEVTADHGEADLVGALALAREIAAGDDPATVLVLTDGAVTPESAAALAECRADAAVPCALRLIDGPDENVAITAFAARRRPVDPERVQVLAELVNLGERPAKCRLEVSAGDVPLASRVIELAPGESSRTILDDVDATHTRLVARLRPHETSSQTGNDGKTNGADDRGRLDDPCTSLPLDDVAHAVVPPLEPFDVLLVSDGGDLFLDAALLVLDEHVRLQARSSSAVAADPALLRDADAVVFDVADGTFPAELPEAHTLVFDPWRDPTRTFPIALGREVQRPRLTEQARRHPLLEGVVFKDVNVARGTTFTTEPGDQVLASFLGEPLIVSRRRGDHLLVAVGFDPRQSDLPLRVAFPLFVANVVAAFESTTPGFVASVPAGRSRELDLADLGLRPDGVSAVLLELPEGRWLVRERIVPVEDGRVRIPAGQPGFVRVTPLPSGAGQPAAGPEGAAAAGARTSGIDVAIGPHGRQASTLHTAASLSELVATSDGEPDAPFAIAPGSTFDGRPPWMVLLGLALLLAVGEWLLHHRRVTT